MSPFGITKPQWVELPQIYPANWLGKNGNMVPGQYDIIELINKSTLLWRHNERDGVLNHQLHDCLLNRSSSRRSKKTSKLRVTGLCAGNSPGTGEFLTQMASNAENVSMWWHHHEKERRLIPKSRGKVKFLLMPTVPRAKTKNHSSILTNGS